MALLKAQLDAQTSIAIAGANQLDRNEIYIVEALLVQALRILFNLPLTFSPSNLATAEYVTAAAEIAKIGLRAKWRGLSRELKAAPAAVVATAAAAAAAHAVT